MLAEEEVLEKSFMKLLIFLYLIVLLSKAADNFLCSRMINRKDEMETDCLKNQNV